jgi:hypothetical protein
VPFDGQGSRQGPFKALTLIASGATWKCSRSGCEPTTLVVVSDVLSAPPPPCVTERSSSLPPLPLVPFSVRAQAIYQVAASTPAAFTDVTLGDNTCTEYGCVTGCSGFGATAGWDATTGAYPCRPIESGT